MMAGGQSINDRLQAARYAIAGQGLARSVCKSTTEEVIGPKKKHLDYLLHCTNEPNVSIPQMANLLIERTTTNSWVVVFKALVTVHHLMCYGNERFTQYLASSNCSFQLSNFVDKANVQGYDMSTFIRRYAKYLNEKALSYRTVAFDFCKVKRGKDDGVLRTMNADKLLKTLPVLQNQVDALLEFDCTANELTNGVINAAFMLLFRDLIRLFACYNDGIINLLEKYFDMNKKMCRDALDIYKKFLIRMDRVGEFLKVAENVGIDKSDIPDLAKAPSSLLDALEQHLQSLEGKRGSGAGTPTQAPKPAYLKHAVTALSNTSSAFGSAAASSKSEMNGVTVDESIKKIVLEEEQAALNQHRERRLKELAASSPTGPPSGSAATNPFLTSPSAEPVIDLFDPLPSGATSKTSDDLLCLKSNPFADSMLNPSQPSGASNFQNSFWGAQNGFTSSSSTPSATTNAFVSECSFAAAFGNESNSNATSGPSLMSSRAPEITVDDEGGRKDLEIPGLNPFANISSTTPSPSGAPEIVRGAGTTPILGGPDGPPFGVPFGEAAGIEAEKTGDDVVDAKSPVRPPPPSAGMDLFPDFDSGFGGGASGGDKPPRPASPAFVAAAAPPAPQKNVDPFGDIGSDFGFGGMQPTSTGVAAPATQPAASAFGGNAFDFGGFDSFGDILQPVGTAPSTQSSTQPVQTKTAGGKVITGDLDSSLAILAQNLDINRGASSMQKGGHVWNSPKNTAKTGGANWAPQIASSTAAWNSPQHGFKTPMSGMTGAPVAGQPADWSSGLGSGAFQQPGAAPMMGQQFMGGPRPPMGAMSGGVGGMGMAPPMGAVPLAQQQQSMFSAIPPRPAMQTQAPMGFGAGPQTTQQPAQGTTLDPFGAL